MICFFAVDLDAQFFQTYMFLLKYTYSILILANL